MDTLEKYENTSKFDQKGPQNLGKSGNFQNSKNVLIHTPEILGNSKNQVNQ